MVRIDNNKGLWRDNNAFDLYTKAAQAIMGLTNQKPMNLELLTQVADGLDQLLQTYEDQYGSVQDPLFLWWFATANMVLYFETEEDRNMRKQYAINGYKEGLGKHSRIPSYTSVMIEQAVNIISQLATGSDTVEWLRENRSKFVPVN